MANFPKPKKPLDAGFSGQQRASAAQAKKMSAQKRKAMPKANPYGRSVMTPSSRIAPKSSSRRRSY